MLISNILRILLLQPTSVHEHFETKDITQCDKTRRGPSFQRLLCWQSHRPEFDYLKSLDIEESINCISFFETPGRSHLLLSANGEYLFRNFSTDIVLLILLFRSLQIKQLKYGKSKKNQRHTPRLPYLKRICRTRSAASTFRSA